MTIRVERARREWVAALSRGSLVMEWTNGATDAFPASDPADRLGNSVPYLVSTAVVAAAGFGPLTTLGVWLRHRRVNDAVRLDRRLA